MDGFQQGMKVAQDTGQTWNALDDTYRPRVPGAAKKIGQRAGGLFGRLFGQKQEQEKSEYDPTVQWNLMSPEEQAAYPQGYPDFLQEFSANPREWIFNWYAQKRGGE